MIALARCLLALTAVAFLAPAVGRAQAQPLSSPWVGKLVDPVLLRGIEDVYLQGDLAYLPCRQGQRLTICSVADPTQPKVVSSFTHADLDEAAGLAVDGSTLYVASLTNHRLLVLDAKDPSAVRLVGSVVVGEPGTKGLLYKVAYRDGHCFVAHQTEKKLFVVDVRDAARPVVVSSVQVTQENDGPFSVLLRGDYILTGTLFGSRNRLAVVDVKDLAKPRLVNEVLDPMLSQVSGAMLGNLYLSVAWDRNAFLVFDLTDPSLPKLVARLVDPRLGKPNRCIVSGNRAYLPMVEGDGVAVLDITDPLKPAFLTAFKDPVMNRTYGAAVRGDLLFVGSREGNSLVVLDRRKLEK